MCFWCCTRFTSCSADVERTEEARTSLNFNIEDFFYERVVGRDNSQKISMDIKKNNAIYMRFGRNTVSLKIPEK